MTVVGTTTLRGNALSVGISSFVVSQGNVGIGTTTPSALFNVVGAPISGGGTQFIWNAASAALRAGEVSGPAWTPAKIAIFSTALGLDNEASGPYASVGGGQSNVAASDHSVIAGGYQNLISSGVNSYGQYSFIGGGWNNQALFGYGESIGGGISNATWKVGATIAGGNLNKALSYYTFVGGGQENTADGTESVVAGGNLNFLGSTCNYCTISGGGGNNAVGEGDVIAGGGISSAHLTVGNVGRGQSSSILGGVANTTNGDFSSVLGGYGNTASGAYSLAAGFGANAATKGSFVWADSENQAVLASTNDEFRIRAGGGYVFLSSPTLPTVLVSSGSILISTSASAASAVPNIYVSSTTGGVGIGTSTFLTGGIFHVAAPANTHTYYDFDRLSPSYDSALSWATNAQRRWFMGFLPSAGAASGDLTIWNTSAARTIETYQDGTGNVGIGTASPKDALDVNGAVRAESNSSGFNQTNAAIMDYNAGQARFIASSNSGAYSNLVVSNCNNSACTTGINLVGSSGNVGIGTASPGVDLDVESSAHTPVVKVKSAVAGQASLDLTAQDTKSRVRFYQTANDASLLFDSDALGTTRVAILGTGNVGIGTANPATKLHMSSGSMTLDGTGSSLIVGDGPTAGSVTQVQLNGSVGAGDRKSFVWNQPGVGNEAQFDMKYFSPDTAFVWGHLYNSGVQTADLMTLRGGGSPTTLDVNGSAQFGNGATKSTLTASGQLLVPYGVTAGSATLSGGLTASSGTFSATGATQYSVALSSSLTFAQGTANIGVRWADGSISTTAFAGTGGGGNVLLTATQTFSGANTFLSSTTYGPVNSTTLNYSYAVVGGRIQVGVATVVGSTFTTFTDYDQRFQHHVTFVGHIDGAAYQIWLQANHDVGANYSWEGSYVCQGGGVTAAGAGSTSVGFIGSGAATQASSTNTFHIDLDVIRGSSTGPYLAKADVQGGWQNAADSTGVARTCSWNADWSYNASNNPITSLTFNSGAASALIYGTFTVEAFVPNAIPNY